MKKASRALVLITVAALALGILCGCGMFTKNTVKYRATGAIQVGNETITIGDLIDTFNSYYNSYSSYISQGYITTDYVLELAVSSLYTQYMKLDAYKTTSGVPTYTHSADLGLENAEYLTDSELEFAVAYVKYLLYTTLDGIVEDYIAADGRTLGDAETEDTSRDFVEYDDFGDASTYSEYIYNQNYENEDMEEYVSKYYPETFSGNTLSVDSFVYTSQSAAQERLDELNSRLDDDDSEITFTELQSYQQQALAQYKKNVLYNYEYDLEQLVAKQSEDMIISLIVSKYNYNLYKTIDTTDLQNTIEALKTEYEELKANQTAEFQINDDFVSYIEDLSDSSYIFNVPESYNYVFVKNILIPFSDAQKTVLSNLQSQLGSSSSESYIAKRNEIAAQIVADDYLSEQDEDGNYSQVENLFKLDSDGNVIINPDGALGQYLNADGTVNAMDGKTATETIVELMKQYNTDTAQHSAIYDYVVRVGEVPSDYTSSWVSEFVDAANEAYTLADGADGGTYAIAVSSYGVHIVYYSAKVAEQTIDFDSNIFVTDTPEYRLFTTYFESQSDVISEENADELKELYYSGKITKLEGLDVFLSENGFTFDFESSISLDDDDE